MTPDVNVLVAAYRGDHVHHAVARRWLTAALESCARGASFELLPMVATGFVRVVTHRKAFPGTAASPGQAFEFLDSVMAVPGVVMPPLGREWKVFQTLCLDRDPRGSDVSDAWIAAAVSVGGYHLVTFDADFGRLLRPTEYTLLGADSVREAKARYAVRRAKRRKAA